MMAELENAPAAPQESAPEKDDAPEMDIDFWTLLVEARIIRVG